MENEGAQREVSPAGAIAVLSQARELSELLHKRKEAHSTQIIAARIKSRSRIINNIQPRALLQTRTCLWFKTWYMRSLRACRQRELGCALSQLCFSGTFLQLLSRQATCLNCYVKSSSLTIKLLRNMISTSTPFSSEMQA